MKKNETEYVIKITKHKTATQGPCLLFLKPMEEQALTAYIKYYRTIVTDCSTADCYVFPNRKSVYPNECCSKITFSNMGRIVKNTAKRACEQLKITSRVLRRSQITALWEKNSDPAGRQQVAELCGHSLETARRYYQYADRIEPGRQVVETLRELRQGVSSGESDVEEPPVAEPQVILEELAPSPSTTVKAVVEQECGEEEEPPFRTPTLSSQADTDVQQSTSTA